MTPTMIGRGPVNMWQQIQTYIFVTVITVLIWLYAESSTLRTDTINPDLEFAPPTGRELLIQPQRLQGVSLVIRGPTSQLAELERLLRQRRQIKLILHDDPESVGPWTKVDLYGKLSAYLADVTPGVTVIDVNTADPEVRVERYEKRTLPIVVETVGDVKFRDKPVIEPPEAEIKLPASLQNELGDEARIVAQLDLGQLPQSDVGLERTAKNVPLLGPTAALRNEEVTISPKTATVTFTITEETRTITRTVIPLVIEKPASAESKYEVVLLDQDPAPRNIQIKGPNEVIDDIEGGTVKLQALLSLTNDDLGKAIGKEVTGTVTVLTPPGVTVITPLLPVRYKVVERSRNGAVTGRPVGVE